MEMAPDAKGQLRAVGPLLGNRYRALVTAVVATVNVAVPVVAELLKVKVLVEELKFAETGVVNPQVGRSTAPAGEPVTAQLSVTVPVNPLTSFNVMSCVFDAPGMLIGIGVEDGVKLNPLTVMLRVPDVAVLP